jgi:hypothetical protein
MFDLMKTLPKWRAAIPIAGKDVRGGWIFGPKDLNPNGTIFMVQPPNPFQHESSIHLFGVQNPKTPKLLRSTHIWPIKKVIFSLGTRPFPKEASPMRVKLHVNSIFKEKHARHKHRQAG